MKLFSALLLCTGALIAQPITVGIKGGARATSDIDIYTAVSESKHYVAGPMMTVRLFGKFRVEADALYRHIGYRTFDTHPVGGTYASRVTGNSWEFPILLRREIGRGVYASAGYALRALSGSDHTS